MDTKWRRDIVCLSGEGGCRFNFNDDEEVMKAAASANKSQVQVAKPSSVAVGAGFIKYSGQLHERGFAKKNLIHDLRRAIQAVV